MATPTVTYDSNTDLSLGAVPNVEDEEINKALLDLHNALSNLSVSKDIDITAIESVINTFINKYRNVTVVSNVASPYSILPTDGLILIDSSGGDVEVITHTAVDYSGYEYTIVCIDDTNQSKLSGYSSEKITGEDEWTLVYGDSITIKSDNSNWWIIG